MTNENFDEKMMQRALGLVEGIAFGLGEDARDVMLGAAEDIDSGIKALEKRAEEAEDDVFRSGNTIHMLTIENEAFMRENERLRDMLKQMATDGECDSESEGETEDATGDNPSVACGDRSPCTGEPLGAGTVWRTEDGCAVCKEGVKVLDGGGTAVWIKGRRLRVETAGFVHSSAIAFCPKCGRKL